ncbi:MAG TPA: ATP-binding protein, partial [bacterium]|nr:ATP-binding protein [bacterium]
GIKKKDVIGGNFETVIPESFRGLFAELLKQNIEINNKDLILSKNGNAIPLRISGSRFYSIDGSLLGAQVIFSDISQLKMLQYQAERNERLASLGILAGGIAHEIRNPLVALKTFSQLLPERFADDKFRSDYLKVVIPEIDRINHLIEQLLVFAKPRPPRMEEFDLISVIESTILLVSNQEKFRNINIQTNFNSKGIKIRADSEKIKQALLNLLFNAAEAIDKKGGVINISVSENEGKSIIEIMDNGSGISSENINKIFDPLFTTKPYGTGLGLSIVNEIIAQHNGRIYIESQDGQGTRVIIYLPLNTGVFQ